MNGAVARWTARPANLVVLGILIIVAGALINRAAGHPWICSCGTVKLWHGIAHSDQTSQHLTDWYTPSHIIHGLVFYFVGWLVLRRWPLGWRALVALVVEVGWEVVENSPWIIDRYREVTVSEEYFGDSVINSTFDVLAMVVGFYLATRIPVWASIAIVVGLELFTGYMIRDNLTLNVLMLLWPVPTILNWQAGG